MPKAIESNIYPHYSGDGYYVTIAGEKQPIYETFTVKKYGSTTKAIEAARKFRDKTLKERSTSSVKGFFKPKELIEKIKKAIKKFKIKGLNFEGKESNLTRLAEVAGIKTIPDPDPTSGSGRVLYSKPTKQIVETIKANLIKAPATEAGKEAFLEREARARELLESGKHTRSDVNRLLGEEFPEVKGMKSTVTKLSKTIKGIPSGVTGKQAASVKRVIEDLKNLDKSRVRSILESGKYTLDSLITRIKKFLRIDEGLAITRLGQLLEAYDGDTSYIDRPNKKIGETNAAKKLKRGLTQGSLYGGIGGSIKRKRYERKAATQIGETKSYFPGVKKRAQELIPEKGWEVDLVKSVAASGRFGTGPYSIFLQGIQSKINADKGSTLDKYVGTAEMKLQNLDPDTGNYIHKSGKIETPEQIKNRYNTQVDDFLKTANKDLKPGELPVRAMHLSWDKPSKTIKNQKGYKQFKTIFDDIHKKYGYSFEVDKDLKTTFELKDFLKSKAGQLQISKFMKGGAGRIFAPIVGMYLGYQGVKNLFNTPVKADTIQLQTAGLTGGTTIPKVDLVPRTVVDEQVTQVAEAPTTDQMTYNATEGKFVKPDGDPETQEGILNWIADHPIYSGLAPVPVGIGAGLGADAMNAKNVGNFFKSMKFMLPPAYAAEKLYQYKQGQDLGEMFTNPLDAVWAMALDTKKTGMFPGDKFVGPGAKFQYYDKASKLAGRDVTLGLKSLKPSEWKNLPRDIKTGMMGPRSAGTALVFPFAKGPAPATMGRGMAALRAGSRLLPLGPIPMALLAGSMAWDKYKFNKKVGDHVDGLRAHGVISEEDAETMNTIYKQGWLGTTAIGAKLLGSEELMLEGELLDIEGQKRILSGMKDFYKEREDTATKERVGDRQEDFFSWFSKGGRVGLAEGGNKKPFGSMTRRGFLKWLVGSIAAGVAAVSGRGLKQAAKTITPTVTKAVPTKFAGVEGMPIWFPRAVEKIKTHGKLIEMADKHYVGGDIYEMMIPVKRTYSRGPRGEGKEIRTELEKVTMEENPLTGEISMHWTGTDNFGDDAVRSIEFKPGKAGYQKFGVDDPDAAAQGMTEFQRVKVEEPEFNYMEPNQADPERADVEFLDIFEEGDEIVEGLSKMTQEKNVLAKDGSVIDVSAEGKGVDEAFQKKIYKDIEGEGQIIPEPEHAGVDHLGNVYGEEEYLEIIGGNIPDHLKKKASGGIVETGNIARRPGAVPPLSGPDPQGSGIVGLFSSPKRVNVV